MKILVFGDLMIKVVSSVKILYGVLSMIRLMSFRIILFKLLKKVFIGLDLFFGIKIILMLKKMIKNMICNIFLLLVVVFIMLFGMIFIKVCSGLVFFCFLVCEICVCVLLVKLFINFMWVFFLMSLLGWVIFMIIKFKVMVIIVVII